MSPAAGQNVDQNDAAFFKDPAVANKQFKLFWMAVGKDDTIVGPGDKACDELLTSRGVKHTFKLTTAGTNGPCGGSTSMRSRPSYSGRRRLQKRRRCPWS
jgi:hypothetical protein